MKRDILVYIIALIACSLSATGQNRWETDNQGGIIWRINGNIPHNDHIEMSGEQVSVLLRYGVNSSGAFILDRSLIFPMLRTLPNNTHGSLMHRFGTDPLTMITVNGLSLQDEQVESISLKGIMTVQSKYSIGCFLVGSSKGNVVKDILHVTRNISPSTTLPMFCELYELKNISDKPFTITIPTVNMTYQTDPAKGVAGSYRLILSMRNSGSHTLAPDATLQFSTTIEAGEKATDTDVAEQLICREKFINRMFNNLSLVTPDSNINTMFAFAKIRACESIFKTKNGYMHSPGGESYYAALWTNDQIEYVNPLFPFIGYETGNLSAINSFRHFAKYTSPDYKPIPSSIIAEGDDIWNGAGDRGDAAMTAYGAARYALARGNMAEAKELWPLIEWCLEFSRRKLNERGVVSSDSDELEGRFPAGTANLCTSSLYYDALLSAAYLGKEIGINRTQTALYLKQAALLRKNIDTYFGANIQGFDTYQYYLGNDLLRSWICMPLIVGIDDRSTATVDALFSPKLWTDDGLLTQAKSTTFWDRSTLYALRGAYACNDTERATKHLASYSLKRLRGNHVPYAIEAYPEGSQRHLSAESGLYCRIITEGLFGIRPTGLHSFQLAARLPKTWPQMALNNVCAFGRQFDIHITREQNKLKCEIITNKKVICSKLINEGETASINL